ncbi:ABC transporter ATP-binding protein [Lysinibacillus sp. NPDC094177]|uniref:ABC transporter ATP-binding protein n=1 Tax=Lysinibacillus sp. NPDC094177 TaxID=3390580 RepID=UPI003CFDD7BB
MTNMIEIKSVTKRFGNFTAIENLNLSIPKGQFITLLGPSGCGKTTLMRMIAGFYEVDGGEICINGKCVNHLPVHKRDTPLVFQDYALFPHLTVEENVAYGLKIKRFTKSEMKEKIQQMLYMFGLVGLEHRYPRELSGGQQQRVAFARALVQGQEVLLMDEPLSNLDTKMRVEVRNELREMQQKTNITAIFVTHDQEEALSLSDKIAVFNKGEICQFGTPWEIYNTPANKFVADFVGVANFYKGKITAIDDQLHIRTTTDIITMPKRSNNWSVGEKVSLMIRPEQMTLHKDRQQQHQGTLHLKGQICKHSFLGSSVRYTVQIEGQKWLIDDVAPTQFYEGEVCITLNTDRIHVMKHEEKAI